MNDLHNCMPFYDCNEPPKIGGYELIKLSGDIYQYQKKDYKMKIKPELEKKLIKNTLRILEKDVISYLQVVCLNLELLNDSRMGELSDLALKIHGKLMMIRNELEDYEGRVLSE